MNNITKLNRKKITVSITFISITLIMGVFKWGFIPLEMHTLLGSVTLMHLPVIIAGICAGPFAGAVSGLVFGYFSMNYFPGFNNIMYFLPRVLIGPVAYMAFHLSCYLFNKIKNCSCSNYLSAFTASITATLTNTFGVLLTGYYFKFIDNDIIRETLLTHALPELIVSVIIIPPIVIGINAYLKS